MTGKNKCKILKDIRRQIAQNNDIELIIEECTYKGECRGTCPRCEAELRYLEAELLKRKNAGKSVAVAGLAAVMLAASGCADIPKDFSLSSFFSVSDSESKPSASSSDNTTTNAPSSSSEIEVDFIEGEIPYYSESNSSESSSKEESYSSNSNSYNSSSSVDKPITKHPELFGAPRPNYNTYYENDDVESTPNTEDYNMDYFLELSEPEQDAFLSIFLRKEIKEIWSTYSGLISLKTKGKTDTYVATLRGTRYKVVISYDKNGYCSSFKTTNLTENYIEETTSQENASQETTSQETTSQETTSQENASQETTSQETTSQETTSQETTSQEITSSDSE